jgi:hypothetical protein
VRNVGDEIAPHRLDALGAADVLRQQQPGVLLVGDELQRERSRLARAQAQRLGEVARLEPGGELRLAHEIGDRLAAVALRVEREVLARRLVAPVQAHARIEHRNAVGQRLRRAPRAHDQARKLAAPAQARAPMPVQQVEHFAPGAARFRRIGEPRLARPAPQPRELAPLVREQHAERGSEQRKRDFQGAHGERST